MNFKINAFWSQISNLVGLPNIMHVRGSHGV